MIVICPGCDKLYNSEEFVYGQKLECVCGQIWEIKEEDIYKFDCPYCGIKYEVSLRLIGSKVECCCGNSWVLEPKKKKIITKIKKTKPYDNLTSWEQKWKIAEAIQTHQQKEQVIKNQDVYHSFQQQEIRAATQGNESKYNYKKIIKSQEFKEKIKTKIEEGFKHSGIINEQLSEILYLQQGGAETEAEIMLEKLLHMEELDSYYRKSNKIFEKTVTFLHIYDKARLFYERKKDYRNSCIYAAMAIYAKILDLKLVNLYDDIDSVDTKYLNQLVKKLNKINSQQLYPEIMSLIEKYADFNNAIDTRNELFQQLDTLL